MNAEEYDEFVHKIQDYLGRTIVYTADPVQPEHGEPLDVLAMAVRAVLSELWQQADGNQGLLAKEDAIGHDFALGAEYQRRGILRKLAEYLDQLPTREEVYARDAAAEEARVSGSCPGCGFSASGISTGCAECARRWPEKYAEMARRISEEEGHHRDLAIVTERWARENPGAAPELANAVARWRRR